MITLAQSGLIACFMRCGLTEDEAHIAAAGSGGQNTANSGTRDLAVYEDRLQEEREMFQDFRSRRGSPMIMPAERLKHVFSLFLSEDEAKIAAEGGAANPANSNGKQNDKEFFQDLLQPIGRNR